VAASGERRGAGNGVVVEVEEESRAAELTATHKMEAGGNGRITHVGIRIGLACPLAFLSACAAKTARFCSNR
jgi:hypothetical protein